MARSLTVTHDEKPATSSLLTGFLLFAIGWLALSAVAGFASEAVGGSAELDAAPIFQQ